jgi:hypothetical protein
MRQSGSPPGAKREQISSTDLTFRGQRFAPPKRSAFTPEAD